MVSFFCSEAQLKDRRLPPVYEPVATCCSKKKRNKRKRKSNLERLFGMP
jgi:hypothetical protein